MKSARFIGLMSGTSVDAIDAALVRIESGAQGGTYRVKVLKHIEHPWPKRLRERLLASMAPANVTTHEISELNFLVAREFAQAVETILDAASVRSSKITAIASHGQTICHLPPHAVRQSARSTGFSLKPKQSAGSLKAVLRTALGSTLQLGDVSVLATLTGITTVGNFRTADMAVGGQGAPLVPWADDALLAHPTLTRCVQNIGGIANVTFLPSARDSQPVLAFDTGPGNMIIDAVVSAITKGKQQFDRNGALAAKGKLDMPLFRKLQAHPYFTRRPPKSTGREEFGATFTEQLLKSARARKLKSEDIVYTVTRLTAWSIADAYLHFLPRLPDEVIVCGGGADNPVLVRMLEEELCALTSEFMQPHPAKLRRIDEFGIPNKAKEATSFALLAAATLDGIPSNIPAVTGASRPAMLGVIARPYSS